jgi:hypothetical protein
MRCKYTVFFLRKQYNCSISSFSYPFFGIKRFRRVPSAVLKSPAKKPAEKELRTKSYAKHSKQAPANS